MTTSPLPVLAGFHRTTCQLLTECSRSDALAWFDACGGAPRCWRVAELLESVKAGAEPGHRYARALLQELLDGLMRQAGSSFVDVARSLPEGDAGAQVEQALALGVRPLLVALYRSLPDEAVAWRYMSKTYGAREFAQALEAGEADALRVVSDVLRVCRELLAARARLHGGSAPALST